jgi:hypothetical protein
MGGMRAKSVLLLIVVLIAIFAPEVLTSIFNALVKVTGDSIRAALVGKG